MLWTKIQIDLSKKSGAGKNDNLPGFHITKWDGVIRDAAASLKNVN